MNGIPTQLTGIRLFAQQLFVSKFKNKTTDYWPFIRGIHWVTGDNIFLSSWLTCTNQNIKIDAESNE